jgi:hypothetical protein
MPELYVCEGWWHPNVKDGRVHDHPEAKTLQAYHRLCERVYTKRETTPQIRKAYCGRSRVDPEGQPGHGEVDSDPGLAFFEYLGPGGANERQCAICGKYEEPHLRVTSVARGAKRIDDHVFVPRAPLDWDAYYDGCRGWD